MCGASKIVGVDMNPDKEEVGKSPFHLLFFCGAEILFFDFKPEEKIECVTGYDCIISIPKLVNRSFRSSNLFGCVIPVPKLINHLFRYSNLSSHIIQSLNLILSLI